MNVLLAAQRRARDGGGDLQLAGPRPAVRKVLQLTGLESVFTVLDDTATMAGS
jgi:anti-sigma B factor antagonist